MRTSDCPILVVDDEPAILHAVFAALEDDGYSVQTAENGLEALDVLDWACPRLDLLDVRLPRMDDWAFARAARERGLNPKILVMTAALDAKRRARKSAARVSAHQHAGALLVRPARTAHSRRTSIAARSVRGD
jgi:CheY-like chemotaxis protein